jgi:hypothetical protein
MFEVSYLAGCAFLVRPNALAAFRASEVDGGLTFTYLKGSLDI